MSIQGALQSSLSSLNVLGQQSSLISNNIANANTPGYAQETLDQSSLVSSGIGGGVVAGKISVLANQTASAVANEAKGSAAFSKQMDSVLSAYTHTLGQASDSASLPAQLSAFTAALTGLSATPNDGTAQAKAVNAAQSLTGTFNRLSDTLSSLREQADQAVGASVDSANNTLSLLAQNETARQIAAANGQSTANYENKRTQLLSSLSTDLPIKVFRTEPVEITLTTDRGTTLYDGSVHALSFTATPTIPPNMRISGDIAEGLVGGLSQVTVDGQAISLSRSGSVAANLQLRDETLPSFGDQLDHLAGNLIATFQSADPTVSQGQTGLFTAKGAALDPTDGSAVAGLAQSISVNAGVDPTQGGATWRVTDGLQAAAQSGSTSNATIIGFVNALQSATSTSALPGSRLANSLGDAVAQVAGSQQSVASNWSAVNTSRGQQASDAQAAVDNQTGVNIDDQMQRLIVVQQTYQASAEVIRTASSMMNALLQAIQ